MRIKSLYVGAFPRFIRKSNKQSISYVFPMMREESDFWTLETCISRLRGHQEGPEALSARCWTVETEVIAEVPLATPTKHAVQESWTGRVWGWVFVTKVTGQI
jgi:hypothetical protein